MAITGKIAAVTGAGMGIGRASAIRLARDGAQVALIDRDPDALAEVAEVITAAVPSQPAEIEALMAASA